MSSEGSTGQDKTIEAMSISGRIRPIIQIIDIRISEYHDQYNEGCMYNIL